MFEIFAWDNISFDFQSIKVPTIATTCSSSGMELGALKPIIYKFFKGFFILTAYRYHRLTYFYHCGGN